MDDFEKRLKEDARAIEAGATPEFHERLDAALANTRQVTPVETSARRPVSGLWWASSLTGLAAAVLVIAFLNWNREVEAPVSGDTIAGRTVPAYVEELHQRFPLDARTAEFEAPLEEELERLKADFERARQRVENDIDFAF